MVAGLCCQNIRLVRQPAGKPEKTVLREVNATFSPGTISLVTGETGAGKSSLLYVLAGLLRPTAGVVTADDKPVSRWVTHHKDLWRRQVGIVFQFHNLFGDLTVLENVMVPLIPRSMSITQIRRRCNATLDRLNIADLAGEHVINLSGGQRQLVAIARAVVFEPQFLLADEPTAHQDSESLDTVVQELVHAAHRRQAVVIVTAHDQRLAASNVFDHICRIHEGRLQESS